ncbi:MAG TPA: dTDP-4-dehydrorhamnose reductase [Candidatus Deferrimicrobium sp.]|nr:dTDP-4-dehydrorhamnose reductase [Candidatus Deferrimicrobium sp.]
MAARRVLVTGCRGQLGADLCELLGREHEVRGISRQDCDIRDRDAVRSGIGQFRPEFVLHTAAWTNVDGCEADPDQAMAVNAYGTENVARACREIGAALVYYSSDYVFDGAKSSPYIETDSPSPLSHYGRSKLAGEEAVARSLDDFIIVRIAWVYGKVGRNFVRTMVRLGREQMRQAREDNTVDPLTVASDQIGNPTWTYEIARQTIVLLASDIRGIVHAASEGETSWYGLATRTFQELSLPVVVRPCTTEEFPRLAPRPRRSSLENRRLKEAGLNVMRPWDIALAEFLKRTGDALLT